MTFRKPTLFESLIPIVILVVLLGFNVYLFEDAATGGSNQIALILAATIASLIAFRLGMKWKEMLEGMVDAISSAMGAILILFLIGSLAGTWLISGIVPTMIYYGLLILNPTIFLVAACVISAIVSLATGSSWTTIATVGIALLGIGSALGISEPIIAGSIISGAYFGDKMSPLSDTTNLAPAMAGTDLFTHIRYMSLTTGPSIAITLVIFLVMGFFQDTEGNAVGAREMMVAIDGAFNVSLWLFMVPVIVVVLIVKKVPALPALLAGTLLGGVFAVIFQPHLMDQISGISGNFSKYQNAIILVSYILTIA